MTFSLFQIVLCWTISSESIAKQSCRLKGKRREKIESGDLDWLVSCRSIIYDPNDPELKESLKYLSLTTEERIKLQAQPFDGKKQCWVPDAKESFVAAEITSTKGEEVTVKTAKGDVSRRFVKYLHRLHLVSFLIAECHAEERRCSANESSEIHLLRWYG